jgi:hypothetical protein
MDKLARLKSFVSDSQIQVLKQMSKGPEHESATEIINRLIDTFDTMKETYQTEDIPESDKIVSLHYFLGGSDWYIVEKDVLPEQYQSFGYARLSGMEDLAEWGYISLQELIDNNVELDFYWRPKKFKDI